MSRNVQKPSLVVWILLGILGLTGLAFLVRRKTTEGMSQRIQRILIRNGVSRQTAKYWVAISAFETAVVVNGVWTPWSSRVFKDSNNPFNLIVPNSKRLSYGEGQTIFATIDDGIQALYDRVIKPFRYPLDAESLEALNRYQKQKGYFISGLEDYIQGCEYWYIKIFG